MSADIIFYIVKYIYKLVVNNIKRNTRTVSVLRLLVYAQMFLAVISVASCRDGAKTADEVETENAEAKAMLQGIWVNTDADEVTLKVKGDSIIYADSTLSPVAFAIIGDSLVLRGYNETRYAIVKQTENVFQFYNKDGDVIRLAKSNNADDNYIFEERKPVAMLNQNQLIKRDSIVDDGIHRYRIYTQINPSTFKVVKSSLSQDGLQTDNVYYDNIINICIYNGGQRHFSRDFHKQDFGKFIPANIIPQVVLSDIVIDKITAQGVEMYAMLCEPDSPESYVIHIIVSHDGKMMMK